MPSGYDAENGRGWNRGVTARATMTAMTDPNANLSQDPRQTPAHPRGEVTGTQGIGDQTVRAEMTPGGGTRSEVQVDRAVPNMMPGDPVLQGTTPATADAVRREPAEDVIVATRKVRYRDQNPGAYGLLMALAGMALAIVIIGAWPAYLIATAETADQVAADSLSGKVLFGAGGNGRYTDLNKNGKPDAGELLLIQYALYNTTDKTFSSDVKVEDPLFPEGQAIIPPPRDLVPGDETASWDIRVAHKLTEADIAAGKVAVNTKITLKTSGSDETQTVEVKGEQTL